MLVEIDRRIKIQDEIAGFVDQNLPLSDDYDLKDIDICVFIAIEIIHICKFRPHGHDSIVELCKIFCQRSDLFKQELLFHTIQSLPFLSRKLFLGGIYSSNDIISVMNCQKNDFCSLFFMDLIDDELIVEYSSRFKMYIYDYKPLFDNKKLHLDCVSNGWDSKSIVYSIKYDDIDSLKQHISDPAFDPKIKLEWNNFEPTYQPDVLSLINISALFGSIQCFKYLSILDPTIDISLIKCAIWGGNSDIIHYCMNNVDCINPGYALMCRRNSVFEWLLEKANNVTIEPWIVVKNNSFRGMKYCLENEISILCEDNNMNNSLHMATVNADYFLVSFFVRNGMNVNHQNDYSKTPLFVAVENRNRRIVEFLLLNGADPQIFDRYYSFPLHIAAKHADIEILKLLMNNGAFVYEFDSSGTIPLFWAVSSNDFEAVKFLLTQGNDKKILNSYSFDIYQNIKDVRIAQSLLSNGISFKTQNNEFDKSFVVSIKNKNVEMIDFFVENGVKYNTFGNLSTIYKAALDANDYDTVVKLVQNGINSNVMISRDQSLLAYAVLRNKMDIVQLMIEKGADINFTQGKCPTALHIAVQNHYSDTVEYLVENGADVNLVQKYDQTPLHDAAKRGDLDLVKYLLSKGANVNAKNRGNITPLQYAMQNNKTSVVEFLQTIISKD